MRTDDLIAAVGLREPAEDLDPYLDAAARCFQRYGFARTSVPDVARELGVSRSTVYRRVGTMDQLARELLAREARRLLGLVGPLDMSGPDTVVRIVASTVRFAAGHPVLTKLARDEPEVMGRAVVI